MLNYVKTPRSVAEFTLMKVLQTSVICGSSTCMRLHMGLCMYALFRIHGSVRKPQC